MALRASTTTVRGRGTKLGCGDVSEFFAHVGVRAEGGTIRAVAMVSHCFALDAMFGEPCEVELLVVVAPGGDVQPARATRVAERPTGVARLRVELCGAHEASVVELRIALRSAGSLVAVAGTQARLAAIPAGARPPSPAPDV